MLKRYGVFAFGVFSYLVGVSSLVAWIGTMLGVIPFQYGVIDFTPNSIFISVLSCLVLTSTFAIQHTVMARGSFKRFVYKDIPVEAERSLFVLTTGIVLHGVLLFWPRNETLLWNIENETVATLITAIALAGWAYLFLATFAINHFELFGLEQTYNYMRGQETKSVPFKESFMYAFDRHPIMTGALIGIWFTPEMTIEHISFSLMFTSYIVAGVSIEERDLIRHWGDKYLDYKARVRSVVPTFKLEAYPQENIKPEETHEDRAA